MLKQIKIKHSVMMLVLEHFLNLPEIDSVLKVIRADSYDHYQISWPEEKEIEIKEEIDGEEVVTGTYTRPDALKEHLKSIFENAYDWHHGLIREPRGYFYLLHPERETSLYLGTESSIQGQVYSRTISVSNGKVLLPSWVLKGKAIPGQDKVIDNSTSGEFIQRVVVDYNPFSTELPFLFFQYLEDSLMAEATEESEDIELINSYYHPEQLGVLEIDELSSNEMRLLTHTLHRNKRIACVPAAVEDACITISSPADDKNHREPNPSDRRAYRPERQVSAPLVDISFVKTNPVKIFEKSTFNVPVGRVAEDPKKLVRRKKALLGNDLFHRDTASS